MSRWLATEGYLEAQIKANKNKLEKCFDTVVIDDQDLTLSNAASGHTSTIGLPSGGTGIFLAHNSVAVTGNQISFGLSNSSGTHDDTLYPAAWSSQIPDSLKTIVLDGSNIKGQRHDNSYSGSIPYANPSDVSNLQSDLSTVEADLQTLEGDVDSKCVKTLEIRDGVLKGKRMDGSFTGNIPVILTTTLDAANAALNYIKNTDLTTALSSYFLASDFASTLATYTSTGSLMPLAVLSDITQALGSYYDQTQSDARYVQQTELTSSYYNQTQSDARYVQQTDLSGYGYMTQTTTSSWTATGTTALSTLVHNKEPSCNWTKRVGSRPNKPYAQTNASKWDW